ncbi:hypothetical protein PspLS_11882 [Pyricularia sp. CBS 133598]|nr:hypothetical protein PspLS_11882 [Pyricularia sp. CBS 133598]
MALEPTVKAFKAAWNVACDVSVEEAIKPISGLVVQAAKLTNEVVYGAKILAEKSGERIPDVAAQTAQDIPRNYVTSVVVLAGAAGIAMIAAPAVFALPALGAVGLSASGPVAAMISSAQSQFLLTQP